MKEFSLTSFTTHLAEMAAETVLSLNRGLHAAATVIENDAKDKLGEYQGSAGPFGAWPELADATKADRVAQGFPENEPLLRTGELRDSIQHEVAGLEAVIGSQSPIAAYQEFGTDRIPPRPFIGPAAFESRDKVEAILGAATMLGLCKGGIPGAYDHALTGDLVVGGSLIHGATEALKRR